MARRVRLESMRGTGMAEQDVVGGEGRRMVAKAIQEWISLSLAVQERSLVIGLWNAQSKQKKYASCRHVRNSSCNFPQVSDWHCDSRLLPVSMSKSNLAARYAQVS